MRVDAGVAVAREVLQRGDHPALLQPRANALASAPTRAGSSPNERMLMTGLRGLLLTSATGAKLMCTPSARPSTAVMRPASCASCVVAGRAERHRARKLRRARDAHPDAPLEIRGRQQRHRRNRLQPVEHRGQLERLAEDDVAVGGVEQDLRHRLFAAETDHAADVRVVNEHD